MSSPHIPLFFGKPSDRAFFDPKDWITYVQTFGHLKKWNPVNACLMTFNYDWFQLIKKKLTPGSQTRGSTPRGAQTQRTPPPISKYSRGIHVFKVGQKRIAAQHVSVGAAKAGINLEILIALGIKKFITIGSAGSLQQNLQAGNICIPTKAIRDEGTSYHYQRPSKYAYPTPGLLHQLKQSLNQHKIRYTTGPTWTTDAPYRETLRKIRAYRKEGCLTVEMEAASLFAIAKFRKASLVSILGISDELHGTHWKPQFHHKSYLETQSTLVDIAIKTLLI